MESNVPETNTDRQLDSKGSRQTSTKRTKTHSKRAKAAYMRALYILRDRYKEEFFELYDREMDKELVDERQTKLFDD